MTTGTRYWLLRWPVFNFAVGVVGTASVALLELAPVRGLAPGEDKVEPLALLGGILLFGFLANIGYRIMSSNAEFEAAGCPDAMSVRQRGYRRALKLWCAAATLPAWLGLRWWVMRHSG